VVRIYQRRGDRFERPIELSCEAGDVVRTPLLPQFEITLTSIFKD
jgi:hypothetical protein